MPLLEFPILMVWVSQTEDDKNESHLSIGFTLFFSWAVLKTDGRQSQKRRIEADGVRAWTLRFPILEIFGVSQKSNGEGAQGSIAGIPDLRLIGTSHRPINRG